MISGKFWHDHAVNSAQQPQFLELLYHGKGSCLQTLQGYNIMYIISILTLKTSGSTLCLDHCLNSLWHALNQMIPPMILKVMQATDNHLLHNLLRCNICIFLRNYMLHMCSNILKWLEIRRIWGLLMALHSKLFVMNDSEPRESREPQEPREPRDRALSRWEDRQRSGVDKIFTQRVDFL